MKTLHEARSELKNKFAHILPEGEIVQMLLSVGRIAAEEVRAREETPAFNRSGVDGYAVISGDTFGATESVPCFLNIVSHANMGEATTADIRSGEAIFVPTGAQIPASADAVVMVEYCETLPHDTVMVNHAVAPKANIIYKGEDCRSGAVLLERGTRITPIHIGIMAAAGITELRVYKLPACAIISTGDELVGIGEELPMGCIRDVNTHMIGAELTNYGCRVVKTYLVKDSLNEIQSAIEDALIHADFVLISGGTSVGDKDYTAQAIEAIEQGSVFAHGLALKPGKPTILAKVGGKAVIGLPGQTVSAYITYKAVVQYYLDMLCGREDKSLAPQLAATLTQNVHSAPGKLTFQAVKLRHEQGIFFAEPLHGKSGLISLLLHADGLIIIGETSEGLCAGDTVDVVRL